MQGVAHEPTDVTRMQVKTLAAVGMQQEHIATKLKISVDTLYKHYKEELALGTADANADIAKTLYQQAKSGNTAAMIFWLKTRARWKEVHAHEHTGADGAPVSIQADLAFFDAIIKNMEAKRQLGNE